MSHNRKLGLSGEIVAAEILKDKGFKILARNWRYGKFELDLICENDELIVFVEVKTRCGIKYSGARAITGSKKYHISMAAQAWLNENRYWDRPCRFDVICLIDNGRGFTVEYYEDAFEFSESLDCSDSNW